MANESLGDQVKSGKELRGLISDTGKIYSEIKKLGKENEKILGATVSKTRQLWLVEAQLSREKKITLGDAKKLQQQQKQFLQTAQDRVALQESFNDASKKSANKWMEMKQRAVEFAGTVWGIVTSPLALMIAGAVFLGKIFYDWVKRGEEFRIATGITSDTFMKLNRQAMEVASQMGHLGINQKEALEYTQALVQEFGDIDIVTTQLVKDTATISVALGISADEAAGLMASFMSITGGSQEMAKNMMGATYELSRMNKVAPSAVMKDIAGNADQLAGYMKDGGVNIAQAAVQARKLGVSIAQTVQIADKLLDFESSIESQMNAMLLTGRSLNLERARMLAISGDLAEMQEEILRQVGSQAEFEAMNVIQRKALADAIGIGVGELGKMIARQSQLNDITLGTVSSIQGLLEGQSLEDVLDAKGLLSPLTQIRGTLQRVTNIVSKLLSPAFESLLKIIGRGAEALNQMLDFITGEKPEEDVEKIEIGWWDVTKALGATAVAALTLWGVFKLFKGLGGALSGLMSFGKGGGIFGSLFGKIPLTSILKGTLIMAVLAGGLFLLGKALQEFADITWKDLAIAGVTIIGLTAAMFALGALLTGPQLIAIGVAVAVIAALGGAFYVLGAGINSIGTGLDSIATGLERIIGMATKLGVIKDMADAIQVLAKPAALANMAEMVKPIEVPIVGKGIAAAGTAAMATGTVIGETHVNVSLDDVVSKLDEIDSRFQNGIDIRLNGAKMGEWLSKEARKA